ncbi:MAG: hypothetical protein Q8L10_05480 [Candidatus Moranbacteria bacterium]|nr:hypothetical protein [Candidatus Moranbacteria bacterium]
MEVRISWGKRHKWRYPCFLEIVSTGETMSFFCGHDEAGEKIAQETKKAIEGLDIPHSLMKELWNGEYNSELTLVAIRDWKELIFVPLGNEQTKRYERQYIGTSYQHGFGQNRAPEAVFSSDKRPVYGVKVIPAHILPSGMEVARGWEKSIQKFIEWTKTQMK